MRIKLRNTILFFLCSCFSYADAQTEGKVLFNRPDEYELPREGQEILKSSQDRPTTSTWLVYSDRDDNPTYVTADLGSQKVKSLNFMDVFYVIDEKDNFLHIFKQDWNATQLGKKNRSAHEVKAGFDDHDYGWVPKDKVLLWSHSLVNDYRFSIKALPVLKNAEAFRSPEKYIKKGGTVYIYNSPDNPKVNENAVKMFQFLYVYKYENKKALIGKSPGGVDPSSSILGWIDTGIVQVWRYSICIWPNASDDAIIEREKNNIKASLFVNHDDVNAWSGKTGNPTAVWDHDPYDHKVLADVKRMPVINKDPNGIIITGNVTDVLEQNGEKIQDANDKAALDARQGQLREKIRTINLVFVIDGSQAILPSFPGIKQGIRDIATNGNRMSSDYHNHIQYAAVVYRNGKDKDCSSGDLSASGMNSFSKNWSDVSDFLDAQSKVAGCSTDNSGTEAMYAGLEKGLRMFADQTDNQNNVIILIGGPGDNKNADVEAKLAGMVAAGKVGIIAYQLFHSTPQSFADFKTQLNRIIKAGNTAVGEQIKKDNPEKSLQLNASSWGTWNEQPVGNNGDTRDFLDYPNSSPLLGAIIYPRIQQSMRQEDLPVVINKTMDTIDNIIDRNLEKFSASLNGVGNTKEEIKLNPTLLRYFNALGENGATSKDVINKYIEGGYQFFITGYTTTTVDKLKYPIFSLVIFASVEEYEQLESAYRNLSISSATSSELRNALCDAMNQIVATYIGDKRAKEEITKMNPDDLQQLITGFKSTNPLLTKHSIADYKDSRKVSDDDVKSLAKNFEAVENKLRKVRTDQYYIFKQGDESFYWLPDNLLNGNEQ